MLDYLSQFNKDLETNENLFDKVMGKINLSEQNVSGTVTGTTGTTGKTQQTTKQPQAQFERGKVYSYDLSKIPVLGVFKSPVTYLTFNSPEEFQAFKAIMYYVNHGFFNTDIKNIQRAIKYGEIDGYGMYPYLSSIFNGQKGTFGQASSKKGLAEAGKMKFDLSKASKLYKPKVVSGPTPKGTPGSEGYGVMDSMNRMNKFVKYFVENLVDANGRPNNIQKNAIIARIKKLVGTNTPAPKKVVPTTKTTPSTNPIEPGANPEDLENGGEDVINYALKGLKESIKREVRKIIKDNF